MEVKEIIAQHEEKMDKTIEALKRELSSIRTGRASKDNIWSVNTEQSYHESRG